MGEGEMSYHEYLESEKLNRVTFYALIMAAMRKADSVNIYKLARAWPEVYKEFKERYNAPGGKLEGD